MKTVDKETFIKSIRAGDIGIIDAKNVFAVLQSWYAHRFAEGPRHASHAFYVSNPPYITEANGIVIKGEAQKVTFLKNIGDATKCWFFRYRALTPFQLAVMNAYAISAVQTAGHYSLGGILQFAKSFILGKRDEHDEGGVFCSEFVSDILLSAIPPEDFIADREPFQITPTYLLNWMMAPAAKKAWAMPACYDGKYFLADDLEKEAAA